MTSAFRAFVFDLDGTLIDTAASWLPCITACVLSWAAARSLLTMRAN